MKSMHPTTERLYEAAATLADTTGQANVARLLSISAQTLGNWENRGMSKEGMIEAQSRIGVSIDWLKTGKGPMHNTQNPVYSSKSTESVFDVLDIKAACGTGIINLDHPEVIRRLVMPSEKALELIGSTNRNGQIRVIIAAKDSMTPTIKPNDLLFVDTSVKDFKGEAIYILLHGGELVCKRLQLLGKNLTVTSDNKSYDSWLWGDRPDETQIIGKVLRALPLDFKIFGN